MNNKDEKDRQRVYDHMGSAIDTKKYDFSNHIGRGIKSFTTLIGDKLYNFVPEHGDKFFLVHQVIEREINHYWIVMADKDGNELKRKNVISTDMIEWI